MPTPLPTLTAELRDQWDLLRGRLEDLDHDVLAEPSAVPGWSVADLVAHLGRSIAAFSACEAQPAEVEPLSLGEYLRGYAMGAEEITRAAKTLAADLGDDPLPRLDELSEAAFERLAALTEAGPDAVVLARRGPITVRDLVLTRIIELVAHGYDLATDLPDPAPVDAGARRLAAEALLEALNWASGYDLQVGDEVAWIKTATGRLTWADAVAAGALRPEYLSDGLPDVSRFLPLI
ncbi:maleylpyruvate isomerase family mycothiol-dependent enzyme [Occultella glacieicola]|uniref:Maleylpyruvate isomerase family mycothiol-dependent enzyme n=1 Tax=Occultella glacieicola TaxID=2518684 RepID=A0ABY2E4B7_9MICO|nr:maleylpyruvate isomerase N-terminal domain-containing protein [Occultella glacieicola]TDE94262.1 maleylpyruvate isomerase family mycothiol-dependent enzyme [Occultella glacieicola]